MTRSSTLSKRGVEYTNGLNLRELYKSILSDPYDPIDNPNGFVNLGVSENFTNLSDVVDFLNKNVGEIPQEVFTYGEGPWGTERLRKAMARFMNRNFNVLHPVDPEHLIFANGVTSIMNLLAFVIADAGDAVLLPRPIYQAFQVDFGAEAKVTTVFASFGDVDQFQPEAVAKYEEAILNAEKEGTNVRAFVLCNPHNPLGQCYPKETIIALMKLCSKYRIHLISDEIYAVSVYDVPDKNAVDFISVLSFDHTPYISPEYCHVVYGLSKDLTVSGCRLGCILLRNKELELALTSFTQFHWSGGPSEYFATKLLESEQWLDAYQQRARNRLTERNIISRKLLDQAGIKYHSGSNAGFFLWMDLRTFLPQDAAFKNGWERERALSRKFVEHKVYLTEGEQLTAEEPGFFRLIFSQEEQTLRTGMKRMFLVLGKHDAAALC